MDKSVNEQIVNDFLRFLKDTDGFHVNLIRIYLRIIPAPELVAVVNANIEDEKFKESIFYYFWLFRKDSEIFELLNDEIFPEKILVNYIYYGFGKWIASG
ncbi:MAG: hypothetical protein AAF518_23595, partial [Spirochaetota bacterium]